MSAKGERYSAKLAGQKTYETKKPCGRGHVAPRVTSTGTCTECKKENDRKNYALNAPKIIERKQEYYFKNADEIRQKRKNKYAENPEKEKSISIVRSAEWRLANPEKVKAQNTLKQNWKKKNPHVGAALLAKRRAAKMQRTPHWLSEDDKWMMKEAYELAALRKKMFGFAWHVDHIIPLQGKKVSGLHVPQNLQVIPWVDNLAKSNKFM